MEEAKNAPMSGWDRFRSSLGLNPDSTVLGIPVTFDKERAVKEAQAKFNKSRRRSLKCQAGTQGPRSPL